MSHSAQKFEPLQIPIQGTNLIEASAGTGKTYGIAALFTRLIVLEKMPVDKVLVVTFTKAATAELKTRLRTRLDEALRVLEKVQNAAESPDDLEAYCNQHHGKDVFLLTLLKQALASESQPRLIVRLKAAITDFDNAAIYTIHGFCQRVLRDFAFLCQAPFDVELSDTSNHRMLVAAQDFWREHISNHPEWARLMFERKYTPAQVLQEISSYVSRPYLTFRRPQDHFEAVKAQTLQTWQRICQNLDRLQETFFQIHPSINGNTYRSNTFTQLFQKLQQAAHSGHLPAYHDKLPMLAADKLKSALKKDKTVNQAALTELQTLADFGLQLLALAEAEQNAVILLKLELLEHINRTLAEQKKTYRERGYDDLLLDVYNALQPDNPHAQTLAQAVSQTWQVALIDEFQDTDPLQYQIFSKLFIHQQKPVFLVGDPKQAIYSFRGADIYAYLQAAQDADHHYTLTTNYRSHAKLINGISALFRRKNLPFVLENIDYSSVDAAREESNLSPQRNAIQIRWLHDSDNALMNKMQLRQRAAEYCADEVAGVLNDAAQGRLNYHDRPLQSGDIAILVRTHGEGNLIAQSLKKRGIQSVALYQESVFTSEEAAALEALLTFWLNPRQTPLLRFVLTGVLFEYNADQLYALNQDEAQLLVWIDSANEALQQWQNHGIYAAIQQFSARHNLETHLLSQGKERSLTNYYQLLECLAEEDEQSHSPTSLWQWLRDKIIQAHNGKTEDSHMLRLESDEALVKIVTMHASKGLQYPLVYCPFAWDVKSETGSAKPAWKIIHRHHQTELVDVHQISDEDQMQVDDEELAEQARLIYVALTRAEEQLTVYAAAIEDSGRNTFAYLLEGRETAKRCDVATAYQQTDKDQIPAMLKANWERFFHDMNQDNTQHTDFVFSDEPPVSASLHHLHASHTSFQAVLVPQREFEWIRHTSFTGLSRHIKAHDHEREELQPSLDTAESLMPPSESTLPTSQENELDIHHFPRGTKAGLCLHEILENLDFQREASDQIDLILATLTRYGFEESWLPAMTNLLDCCRETPLTGHHSLSDIAPDNRLTEMGFTLYMEDFNLSALRAWFAQPHLGLPAECILAAEQLDFQKLQGYLNGFIDMTYQDPDGQVCIIDYKSNHLGENESAYTSQAMNQAMAEHHYYLQALIYAIAVGRYFKLRGQPLSTIAIRYLFLRGMNGTANGIWTWDIDMADLEDWLN